MWADGEEERAELLLRAQQVKQLEELKARQSVNTMHMYFYVCICVCVYGSVNKHVGATRTRVLVYFMRRVLLLRFSVSM